MGHVSDRFPAGSSVGSGEGAVSRDAAGLAGLDALVGVLSEFRDGVCTSLPPGDSARDRKLRWLQLGAWCGHARRCGHTHGDQVS